MKFSLGFALLTVMLLLEAGISRAITGTATHEALVLGMGGAFLGLGALLPRLRPILGGVGALGLVGGGWWLMNRGLVPILYSELPLGFHLALGWHFWAWSQWSARQGRLGWWQGGLVVLGALVGIWTLGNVEIYGSSPLFLRWLSLLVLAASVVVAILGARSHAGSRSGVATVVPRADGRRGVSWGRRIVMAGIVAGGLGIVAWSMELGDRAATQCYRWLELDEEFSQLSGPGAESAVVVPGAGRIDTALHQLPRRADLSLSHEFRFGMHFDDEAMFQRATADAIYLRTSSLAVVTEEGQMAALRKGDWIYDSDDGVEDGITHLGDPEAPSSGELRYWMLVQRADAMALPLMVGTRAAGVSGLYAFADDWYQLALRETQSLVQYEVSATPQLWEEAIKSGGQVEKGETSSDYLQLPSGRLTDELLELTTTIAPRSLSTGERLEAIQRFLGETCRYSLQYENPEDLPPVENFLFSERQGHCELYAASTAMMARAIGVPSRVAFGFSGGVSDPERRLVAFLESDYHAWAEVFLEDQGWVVFDTTPDGMGAASVASESPDSEALQRLDPTGYQNLGRERLLGQVEVSPLARWTSTIVEVVSRWFLLVSAVICVALAARAGFLRRKSSRVAGERGPSPSVAPTPVGLEGEIPSVRGLLESYLERCSEGGYPKPAGQTLAEHLHGMKSEGACGEEFDDLVRYLYRRLYGLPGGSDEESREREFRQLIAESEAFARPEAV